MSLFSTRVLRIADSVCILPIRVMARSEIPGGVVCLSLIGCAARAYPTSLESWINATTTAICRLYVL